jgi:hypothetical protein
VEMVYEAVSDKAEMQQQQQQQQTTHPHVHKACWLGVYGCHREVVQAVCFVAYVGSPCGFMLKPLPTPVC